MIENNFEGYIGLFIFYILPINYATFMDQIIIFGLVESKRQLSHNIIDFLLEVFPFYGITKRCTSI